MVEFAVLSRREFEVYSFHKKHIAISITDPESEEVKIKKSEFRVGLLKLSFHDFDKRYEDYPELKLFESSHAKEIIKFVNEYKDSIELIVVHCEAGISRSSGVAAALCLCLGGDNSHFFKMFLPNSLVYSTILKEWNKGLQSKN